MKSRSQSLKLELWSILQLDKQTEGINYEIYGLILGFDSSHL